MSWPAYKVALITFTWWIFFFLLRLFLFFGRDRNRFENVAAMRKECQESRGRCTIERI